jgi:hypothetical protein
VPSRWAATTAAVAASTIAKQAVSDRAEQRSGIIPAAPLAPLPRGRAPGWRLILIVSLAGIAIAARSGARIAVAVARAIAISLADIKAGCGIAILGAHRGGYQ